MLASIIALNTANTTLALTATPGEEARIVYYGAKLPDAAQGALDSYHAEKAYPCYGVIGAQEAAYAAIHPDGNRTVQLWVEDTSIEAWEGGQILCINCKDNYYPLRVKIYYKTFRDQDMIETWTESINEGKKPVTLTRFDSGLK